MWLGTFLHVTTEKCFFEFTNILVSRKICQRDLNAIKLHFFTFLMYLGLCSFMLHSELSVILFLSYVVYLDTQLYFILNLGREAGCISTIKYSNKAHN